MGINSGNSSDGGGKKDQLGESQKMRIEINHRPVHQNFRKRKID
jgi:hypothetical protein